MTSSRHDRPTLQVDLSLDHPTGQEHILLQKDGEAGRNVDDPQLLLNQGPRPTERFRVEAQRGRRDPVPPVQTCVRDEVVPRED
jgi:hypothetical protein